MIYFLLKKIIFFFFFFFSSLPLVFTPHCPFLLLFTLHKVGIYGSFSLLFNSIQTLSLSHLMSCHVFTFPVSFSLRLRMFVMLFLSLVLFSYYSDSDSYSYLFLRIYGKFHARIQHEREFLVMEFESGHHRFLWQLSMEHLNMKKKKKKIPERIFELIHNMYTVHR